MRTRAWDQFADFLETVFVIGLGASTFVYLVLGDRLDLAEKIVGSAAPFSFVAFLYSLKLKYNRRELKKNIRNSSEDLVLAYVVKKQIRRDLILTVLVPFLMVAFNFLDQDIQNEDLLQITVVFALALAWHRFFWKSKDNEGAEAVITKNDKLKDELVIYSLPLLVLGISLLFASFDVVDALQALASLAPILFSRYLIYKGI